MRHLGHWKGMVNPPTVQKDKGYRYEIYESIQYGDNTSHQQYNLHN